MWAFVGVLMALAFIIKFWWVFVAAGVLRLVVPWLLAMQAAAEAAIEAADAEELAMVHRADQQHAWALAGDPRGTYGKDGDPATW